MDPRALAYVMLRQGRSLAEIRNELSARDVPLEEIEEITDEIAGEVTEQDALALANARQDARAGLMMVVASVVIAGVVALADLPSQLIYIIPGMAMLLGMVRLAKGLARIRSQRQVEVKGRRE